MLADAPVILLLRLAFAAAPVALVIAVFWRWSLGPGSAVVATGRMLIQLLLIGYLLEAVFEAGHPLLVAAVLAVMVVAATGIALRTIKPISWRQRLHAGVAIGAGGGLPLLVTTQAVLAVDPWFEPRYVVPLGGMGFAAAMNAVGLAAERFASERESGVAYEPARDAAFNAAMIPAVNALLAVGLVAIPGMMTGQVLAGADPLIAARYQVMVMAMVFSAAGLSAAAFLALERPPGADPQAEQPS